MSEEHQKRVCIAVAKAMARRSSSSLEDVTWPDEEIRDTKAVDMQFSISGTAYVLEHTRIESFPEQIRDSTKFLQLLGSLETFMPSRLHPGYYRLIVPSEVMYKTEYSEKESALISKWIEEKARDAPDGDEFEITETPDGISFPVTLVRENDESTTFLIMRSVPDQIEDKRIERIRTALENKCPKLAKAKTEANISILLLESKDIALANERVIARALEAAISAAGVHLPDIILLVETDIGTRWYLRALKEYDLFYPDTNRYGPISPD